MIHSFQCMINVKLSYLLKSSEKNVGLLILWKLFITMFICVCPLQVMQSSMRLWAIPWFSSGEWGATCTKSSSAPSPCLQVLSVNLLSYISLFYKLTTTKLSYCTENTYSKSYSIYKTTFFCFSYNYHSICSKLFPLHGSQVSPRFWRRWLQRAPERSCCPSSSSTAAITCLRPCTAPSSAAPSTSPARRPSSSSGCSTRKVSRERGKLHGMQVSCQWSI